MFINEKRGCWSARDRPTFRIIGCIFLKIPRCVRRCSNYCVAPKSKYRAMTVARLHHRSVRPDLDVAARRRLDRLVLRIAGLGGSLEVLAAVLSQEGGPLRPPAAR